MKHLLFLIIPAALILNACTGDSVIVPDPDLDTKHIDRIEVDYFFDNVTYVFTYYDTTPQEVVPLSEHAVEITTIAGESGFAYQRYVTEFGSTVLGKSIGGNMYVEFINSPKTVDVNIIQSRSFDSFLFGRVTQVFGFVYNGIPYNQSYTDDFTELEVDEYYLEKKQVCANLVECTFSEDNAIFHQAATAMACGDRAYVKVKVHFKP